MRAIYAATAGLLSVAVSFSFTSGSQADPVELLAESGTMTETVPVTVEEVDVKQRLLTVIGPQGYTMVLLVDPKVEHLETIKVKEKVTITYSEEVATALRKSDEPTDSAGDQAFVKDEEGGMNMDPPTIEEQDWVETTPKGATDLTLVEVSDTVAAVNRAQRTITFAGTGGKTRIIRIDPSVAGFDAIEPGDRVVLLVTRGVAVSIKPA
jgi:hypothetical protein